jgi:hypothetical protein
MYKEDQRVALERLGPVLVQYYGLGEVTGAITVLRAEDHGPARDTCRRGLLMDEADVGSAPVWTVFGDLMAGLLGAFVLILSGAAWAGRRSRLSTMSRAWPVSRRRPSRASSISRRS